MLWQKEDRDMRLSGLIPLVVAMTLSGAVIAIADAHSWSDSTTQGAIIAIIGGTTLALFLTDWRETRLHRGQEGPDRRDSPRGRRGTT
jgi:hypothetical protein